MTVIGIFLRSLNLIEAVWLRINIRMDGIYF